MKSKTKNSFTQNFSSWSDHVISNEPTDWTAQLQILNDIAHLITTEITIEEITRVIYANVNKLLDAFQFAVGIYDAGAGTITYKGMIEDGKPIPTFSINADDTSRLAAWCIRNEKEIFMNDFDNEITRYLDHKPIPIAGSNPQAAIYVPLKLNNTVVGMITVRTIHKNVYRQQHLHILKAVGNFVVRAIELSSSPIKKSPTDKEWHWADETKLSSSSKKLLHTLTERERQVLLLLLKGLPNKTIATQLFVSAATIKTHTLNIYLKLDVANRTAATMKALELGWVQ